jgi:hypothetical protein
MQAAATYRTKKSTYVAFRASPTTFSTFRITATNPPAIASSWGVIRDDGGCGSPFVTSTDGTSNMIVWVVVHRVLLQRTISDSTVMMETPERLFTTAVAQMI